MPYITSDKGPDNLFKCPRCSDALDEEAVRIAIIGMMHLRKVTDQTFVVYVICNGCGAELEAKIDARLQTDNEVFSPYREDDEPEDTTWCLRPTNPR